MTGRLMVVLVVNEEVCDDVLPSRSEAFFILAGTSMVAPIPYAGYDGLPF